VVGVGRSFLQKTWGQGRAKKKSDKKSPCKEKKTELGKKRSRRKKDILTK
jgi:hypothetical protein